MATTNTRTASRSPVTLKIKFKSTTLEQFIERYSVDISHGGIFIRTKDPLPVGTNLRFEFQLKDASPLITGDGTVVWTRDFDPSRSGVAPGMGVRFDRLPSESQDVLDQILSHKTAKLGKSAEPGFLDAPTKVAFGNIPTRVTPQDVLDGLNQAEGRRTLLGVGVGVGKTAESTPLPLPSRTDLDEFPDEAFEQATKVASLDALARRSAESEREEAAAPSSSSASSPLEISPLEGSSTGGSPIGGSASEEASLGGSIENDSAVKRHARLTGRPGQTNPPPRSSAPSDPPRPREPARESGAMAALGSTGSPPSGIASAPILHDLPARSPFSPEGEEERGMRPEREARDTRPPPHADPFSLPAAADLAGDGSSARRASGPLRMLDGIPPPMPPASAMDEPMPADMDAEVTRPEIEPEASNMPWIAAAAVLLLVGGVCGFWLLSGRGNRQPGADEPRPPAEHAARAPSGAAPPAAPALQPLPATPAPVAPVASPIPPVAQVQVTVASSTEGATAELVGTSQRGPTPMTFRGLEAGRTYRVRISKAGFFPIELTVNPDVGADDPPAVELKARPTVLHVTSEPAGAQVLINGRRQRSLTPLDVELPRSLVEAKLFTVALRMRGYSTAEQKVELNRLVERGDTMVQELSVQLVKRPVPPPADLPTKVDGAAGSGAPGDARHDGAGQNQADGSAASAGADGKDDRKEETGHPGGAESSGGGASDGKADANGAAPNPKSPGTGSGPRDPGDPLVPDWMKPEQ